MENKLTVEELRIGNLIYATDGTIKEVTIEALKYIEQYTGIHQAKPIHLSEEWLLKFGFDRHIVTKEDNQIWRKTWDEGVFDLEQIISFFFGHPMYSVQIKYVHQLQNLYFSLTQKELAIEIQNKK